MGKEIKEFSISGVVYNEDNKYTEEEINDMFIEWVESKGLWFGGMVRELESESDKELLRVYMKGFNDELWGKEKDEHSDPLMKSAYLLGCEHAIIGDEVSSIDDLTNKEILKLIKNG